LTGSPDWLGQFFFKKSKQYRFSKNKKINELQLGF